MPLSRGIDLVAEVRAMESDFVDKKLIKISEPYCHEYENIDRIVHRLDNLELRERLSVAPASLALPVAARGGVSVGGVGERCSGCRLTWDKGKRRRLVEACGHARCAACAARSAVCPQCLDQHKAMAPRSRAKPVHRLRPTPTSHRHSSTDSDSDEDSPVRSRLGGLLGARRRGRGRAARRPRPSAPAAHARPAPPAHAASLLSLVSLDVSPVSTLTGSSEAEVALGPSDTCRRITNDSLPSVSPSPAGSFCSQISKSLTASQDDSEKCIGSPFKHRKYEEGNVSRNEKEYYLHSMESIDGFGLHSQLPLKPLYFEVAQSSREPFIGRSRLLSRVDAWLNAGHADAGQPREPSALIVSGSAGSGKTTLVLQLVERSCFGRGVQTEHFTHQSIIKSDTDSLLDKIAVNIVGYHFCQADNAPTCQRAELVHSIAAQLCQAPGLAAYRRLLIGEPAVLAALTPQACAADPMAALHRGVLQPLTSLHAAGALPPTPGLILVDALCEADYHRPEAGGSLGDFLLRATAMFPPCLRLLMTRRTPSVAPQLPQNVSHIPLDTPQGSDRDIFNYVFLRLESDALKANVKSPTGKSDNFAHYVTSLARGSFLFAKLVLDLCESGLIVLKASNYKVIPVNLAQIFMLQFNIRFPTSQSFEKISHILGVCLASLYPLTENEIYATVNSLLVDQFLSPAEFHHRIYSLKGFLVKRSDGTNVFFHPAFREWLVRRDAGDSDKFLCDLRAGHAALAFKLSRVNAPLDSERTAELAHHALKAHPFKEIGSGAGRDLLAAWIADASSNSTDALVDLRNAYCPNAHVSRLLLLSGALADASVETEGAPLTCVWAARGETAALSALLDAQASVDTTDTAGRTPLAHAALSGHEEVARALISVGADPSAQDSIGFTPLSYAAQAGHGNLVTLLLAAERDTPASLTALVAAASSGHALIVSILLDAVDSQVDSACPISGCTALTAACNNLNGAESGVVEILLSFGVSVDRADGQQKRALTSAAACGSLRACQALVSAGASVCQVPSEATSPLMASAANGHLQIVLFLLENGANCNKLDALGRGALWWSCVNVHSGVVAALLSSGANADCLPSPPAHLFARPLLSCRSPAIAELLMQHAADPERVDASGDRLIDKCVIEGNLPMINCLLKKGVKLGPNTWNKAEGKPHIIGMLVNKLLDDGNALYRKGELSAAEHRYSYALRHLPNPNPNPNPSPAIQSQAQSAQQHQYLSHLKANLLLNLARCKRKLNEPNEALELAISGASVRPLSWEGWYGVARAARALGDTVRTANAAKRALSLLPPQAAPHLSSALRSLIQEEH